jgi:hypothetical protein
MSGPNPPRLEASSLFVEQNKKDHIRCEIYNTILSRVHQKIQGTNRLPGNTQQLIYLVPEFIPGVPRFDINPLRLSVLKRKSLICGKLPITRLLREGCHNMFLKVLVMNQQPRMFILSK